MDANFVLAHVLNSAAEIEARFGQWQRVVQHAQGALKSGSIASRTVEIGRARVLLARAAAAQGRISDAQEEIAQVEQIGVEQMSAPTRAAIEQLVTTYFRPSSAQPGL
jgi:hypothetical protein